MAKSITFLVPLLLCIISCGQIPLVGAYYFDGWAGTNSVKDAAWAADAPTHLTEKLACRYPDRQPVWGWRDDRLEIMERQIELASGNGIDFFSFCWYWKKDNGGIDTAAINRHPLHTGIELFKEAKNKKKMRFSLLVANHQGARIKTEKDWTDAVDFWTGHYFNDPQYLKIDGKPVITVFESVGLNGFIPAIRQYVKSHTPYPDLFIISNNYNRPDSHYDMLSWYNIREAEPGHAEEREYAALMGKVGKAWNAVGTGTCVAPCVMVNWDRRPWETASEGLYYTGRTPELFRKQVEEALRFACARNPRHRVVMIYAWNELGEGGYLVPTQGDREAVYLGQVRKAKESCRGDAVGAMEEKPGVLDVPGRNHTD